MADYPATITTRAPGSAPPREPTPRAPRQRTSIAVRLVAGMLIVLGGLALADGAITLLWQEPISALIAKIHQGELSSDLLREEHAAPSPSERQALAGLASERRRISFLAGHPRTPGGQRQRGGPDRHPARSAPHSSSSRGPTRPTWRAVRGSIPKRLPRRRADDGRSPDIAPPSWRPSATSTRWGPARRILLRMPYAHFTYTVIGHRVVLPENVRAAVAASATSGWCSPPAHRCSVRPNGCWSTPA